MRLLPAGELAFLVEVADAAERRSLFGLLTGMDPLPGIVEAVPGARTVLVRVAVAADLETVAQAVGRLAPVPAARSRREPGQEPGQEVVVPVRYDGPDLDDVARLRACSPEALVAWHGAEPWVVEFIGFAPGFGYLSRPDAAEVPRLDTPRIRVPAGSVGLAGPYSGVYPRASSGGWRLIGTTAALVWDQHRDPPALLEPGARVRFEAVP